MKILTLSLIAVTWIALASENPAAENPASSTEVKIDNFSFTPQTLTVAPGTRVTWLNKDDVPHTVTSTTNLFKSDALDTDGRFSFTFSKPGTYNYFCTVHPHMTGKVIVQQSSSAGVP